MNESNSNSDETGTRDPGPLPRDVPATGRADGGGGGPGMLRGRSGRRTFQRLLFFLACLATLFVILYFEEELRGRWAWKKFKQEMAAQGVRLDWAAYIPPPIPASNNFAKTPLLEAIAYRPGVNSNVWERFSRLNFGTALGGWKEGRTNDLKEAQESLRSDKSLRLASLPEDPVADVLAILKN